MTKSHVGLPKLKSTILSKRFLLSQLKQIDSDLSSKNRVLMMETDFRRRLAIFFAALPLASASLASFNTSPYVLLFYSALRKATRVSTIEPDIFSSKLFSSMETSAGKMIEAVTLPVYGWDVVLSQMHTPYSALDGMRLHDSGLEVATLKSGPKCLNDEMVENFADAILEHSSTWANDHSVNKINFTYGVLYGTYRKSNKKDWHILRTLYEKIGSENFLVSPHGQWRCEFKHRGVIVKADISVGIDWWLHLGNAIGVTTAAVEVWTALIRACVATGVTDEPGQHYTIRDIENILSGVPTSYNVGLLQRSQLPWLFLVANHFADGLEE